MLGLTTPGQTSLPLTNGEKCESQGLMSLFSQLGTVTFESWPDVRNKWLKEFGAK